MKTIDTMNLTEWHTAFQACTSALSDHIHNLDFIKAALHVILPIKPKLLPKEERIFELHAHLHVLILLVNISPTQALRHGTFIGFHTYSAITEMQQLIDSILQPSDADSGENYPQLFDDSVAFIRKLMLLESGERAYFSHVYFRVWQYWLPSDQHAAAMYAKELELLQVISDKPKSEESRYPCLVAQAWMNSLLHRDSEAISQFDKLNSSLQLRPADLILPLSAISSAAEWERLLEWLIKATTWMQGKRLNSLELFYTYWDQAILHIPSAEQQMWEPLFQLSPSLYEKKLLVHGKWKLWIDFQISMGTDPFQYKVSVFAPIEKNAPELLLPFYHQAVESYVLLKNRGGYKIAVKLLKRLAKLYKKLKNEPRWEAYIVAFASRYSRLRALQEELRKGKLIT
ncbi:hypothetical protein [Paenibacillus sinopodophylli]|uniref:hypothetical protein n=1 Tax=Paenibacillus sinopodophylli TaxID=1837342 RepID=UPI00110CFEFB|nr:hypothetical protein [Paenibacillus sinopodophylli]